MIGKNPASPNRTELFPLPEGPKRLR